MFLCNDEIISCAFTPRGESVNRNGGPSGVTMRSTSGYARRIILNTQDAEAAVRALNVPSNTNPRLLTWDPSFHEVQTTCDVVSGYDVSLTHFKIRIMG